MEVIPIKSTWKGEGLVDTEQLGRWKSDMEVKGSGSTKEKVYKEEIEF